MLKEIFPQFSDNSRIWVYGFKNTLSEQDKQTVHSILSTFINSWKSHGRDIEGDYVILENRFIIFAISEKDTISGCSIDSSIRILLNLRESFGLDALDQNIVFFKRDNRIQCATRYQFMEWVSKDQIDEETLVYDVSFQTVGDLRRGEFLRKFRDSWAAVAYSVST